MSTAIKGFFGENRFLSNFYPAKIIHGDFEFYNAEAAYQAAKTLNNELRAQIATMTNPAQAKRFGKSIPIRNDWEKVKVQIMEDICYIKFINNPKLRDKLLATGDRYLEEVNTWGDKFWGTVDGEGMNKLGFTLMKLRDKLRQEGHVTS